MTPISDRKLSWVCGRSRVVRKTTKMYSFLRINSAMQPPLCNSFIAGFGRSRVYQFGLLSVALFSAALSANASLPYSLGQATSYAVLGLGGMTSAHGQIEVYQTATIANGNV